MTTRRLLTDRSSRIDLACTGAARFILWRRGDEVYLTLDEGDALTVDRALAYRGVRSEYREGGIPAPPRLIAAVGTGLAPARLTGDELDIMEVRVVPLAEATARLTRRPLRVGPIAKGRRERCRVLLRGADELLEVRRTAWCGRSTLSASRRVLRPVLFDRAAIPRPQRVYATDGALSRWVSG